MMKAFVVVILAVCIGGSVVFSQKITEEHVVMPSGPGGSSETEQGKILKVFSAEKEGAIYRAYLVNWKGREIVVSDLMPMPGAANKKVGDTITFMVNKAEMDDPNSGKKIKMLQFIVIPEMEQLPTKANKIPSPSKARQIGK